VRLRQIFSFHVTLGQPSLTLSVGVVAGLFCCRRYQYGRFFLLNIYTLPFAVQPHGYYTRVTPAAHLARAGYDSRCTLKAAYCDVPKIIFLHSGYSKQYFT
jgi:hypothetical protein